MSYKPMIGITPNFDPEQKRVWVRPTYTNALIAAGAVPVILDQYTDRDTVASLVERLDGFLFSGGCDIHPQYYGEEIAPNCGPVAEERDTFESMLFSLVDHHTVPVLGICRGVQSMNVFAGGSLHQHIDDHVNIRHAVTIERGTRLHSILGIDGVDMEANSFHHQAVKVPAPGYIIAAHAADGTVEAIERPGERFFIGVQWHPEIMDDAEQKQLLCAFCEACRTYAKTKK